MPGITTVSFDLSTLGETGIRAIKEGLLIDHENVAGANLDRASWILSVELYGPEAVKHVEAFVDRMRRTYKIIGKSDVKERQGQARSVCDIDSGLLESGDLHVMGEGLIGLKGNLLKLYRFFEREFRTVAAEFGAADNHYPAMIPNEILAEVGYLKNFPQHITFCSHLRGSLPLLESIALESKIDQNGAIEIPDGTFLAPRHVLTPAVCLPCYRQLRGARLEASEVRTLTMQNHVFRYEGANFRPLARAWDFTVRDIVFFGGNAEVKQVRSDVMDRTLRLCRDLELDVTIELANDPFFLNTSRDKVIYQRLGEIKYELLFPMPHRHEPLAASSFNLHRDYYTSIYDIRRVGGEMCESACMGFGLERWVYGLLSQKGLDPSGWPRRVKSNLS